jgi:sortase A
MQLDVRVYEGRDARALRDGPWHRPNTGSPDTGGNMVIAAHRFTYTQPRASFYHLDVVRPGDEIGIFWHGKKYLYTVQNIRTVPATDISIEAQTTESQLTLYTCTPLWNPKNRLIVTAVPKENS